MIWNEPMECMSRDQMHDLQSRRLKDMVVRVYHNVPFYRKKMQEIGIEPGDIKSVEDLVKLPFTTKQDLRDNYPFGLFATPKSEVVRVHASSGTTGKSTVVAYTRKDVDTFAEVVARSLCCSGVTRDDIVQVAYGYGLFTGGLGLHYGAEKLGAAVVPISGGNTAKQIMLLQDFGSTVLACTPSYAAYLAEAIAEAGIDPATLPLRVGVFGAEPWSQEMRMKIEEGLKIQAFDIYGLSEIIGPGVSNSCECQKGLHIAEDHFIPEILDPNTLEQVAPGTTGELVFTTVTKEAMPLLRYRTRDLSSLDYTPCDCGRTNVRMAKIFGRSDDMLIIRGVNVFPSQVESVLLEIPEAKPHYMLIVDRQGTLDTLEIQVEIDDKYFSDEIAQLTNIRNKIKQKVESILGVSVIISLVEHKTIKRSEGKAQRVIDKRKI
ncbi:phenylacetate--CoA ligase family protein [Sinanaerobacter chloroacetimidivorans]|uniref:Phenylacetate-coenzyme A ligase n=1 Tax=Sinanaerobacter chloroacetimidivorans TaxID=2818044 RepID=A0A8J7W0Z3_9FIRM|nr:phenylacetate--CoA ligase [Sinanaerobacter chloroacetimidivorans]MBR0597568.1 phenylacetate--CoA ligase [Sinanaerobacter chloroacetimidivorans]